MLFRSAAAAGPIAAPRAVDATPNVPVGAARIVNVKRTGKFFRVTVSAPAGTRVALFRNGVRVASGVKRVFIVPVGRLKAPRFAVSS